MPKSVTAGKWLFADSCNPGFETTLSHAKVLFDAEFSAYGGKMEWESFVPYHFQPRRRSRTRTGSPLYVCDLPRSYLASQLIEIQLLQLHPRGNGDPDVHPKTYLCAKYPGHLPHTH